MKKQSGRRFQHTIVLDFIKKGAKFLLGYSFREQGPPLFSLCKFLLGTGGTQRQFVKRKGSHGYLIIMVLHKIWMGDFGRWMLDVGRWMLKLHSVVFVVQASAHFCR